MWLRQIGVVLCWSSLVLATHIAQADDTELFIYDFNKAGDFRPKVLLIFDTSGSMKETMQVSEAFDPAKYILLSLMIPMQEIARSIYISLRIAVCQALTVLPVFRTA
ncbi:hypothetical protein ACSZM1_18580 [Aeromonas veronii]